MSINDAYLSSSSIVASNSNHILSSRPSPPIPPRPSYTLSQSNNNTALNQQNVNLNNIVEKYKLTKYPPINSQYQLLKNKYAFTLTNDSISINAVKLTEGLQLRESEYLTPLKDIKLSTFIMEDDFGDDPDPNTYLIRTVQIQNLIDNVSSIIDRSILSPDDNDDAFNKYLDDVNIHIQDIISIMLDEVNFMFNPLEKAVWVHFITAATYEPRAVKYLIRHLSFNSDMFKIKDRNGDTFMINLCRRSDTGLLRELYNIGILNMDMFVEFNNRYKLRLTPLLCAVTNIETFKFIYNNYVNPKLEEPNRDKDKDKDKDKYKDNNLDVVKLFMTACTENKDTALFILNSNLMNKVYFNTSYIGHTCLTVAALFNPDLLPYLVESEYCNIELFNKENRIHGNILMIASVHNPHMISYLMNCTFMTSTMILYSRLKYVSVCSRSTITNLLSPKIPIYTNILFELSNSKYILDVINHPLFKIVANILLKYSIRGQTIFSELARVNPEALELLLNSDLCTPDMLIYDGYDSVSNLNVSYTCLTTAALHNSESVWAILNSSCCSQNLIEKQDTYGRNLLIILLSTSLTKDRKRMINYVVDRYLTTKLLLQKDITGLNTFAYLCIKTPEIARSIMSNDTLTEDVLHDEYQDKLPMVYAIACMSKRSLILKDIVNSDHFCEAMFYPILSSTSNMVSGQVVPYQTHKLLFEMCIYNRHAIDALLDNCSNFTELVFNSKDFYGNSFLMAYIIRIKSEHSISTADTHIINNILQHRYCTARFLNYQNFNGETAFLLASKSRSTEILSSIINSPNFTEDMFTKVDNDGFNCFTLACYNCISVSYVKLIADNAMFTRDMFLSKNKVGRCNLYAALNNVDPEVSNYVLNHNYCTEELFKNGVKQWFNFSLSNNLKKINSIINSKYFTKEILNYKTNNGMNMLAVVINNATSISDYELAIRLLTSEHCSHDILSNVDRFGKNCLYYTIFNSFNSAEDAQHLMYSYSSTLFRVVLDSKYCSSDILSQVVDPEDNLISHKIGHIVNTISKDNPLRAIYLEDLKYLIRSPLCTTDILISCNNQKFNMVTYMSLLDITDTVLQLPTLTYDAIQTSTDEGCNCLHIAAMSLKYDCIGKILRSSKCTPALLECKTLPGEDTFLTLYPDALECALASPHSTTKFLETRNSFNLNILDLLGQSSPDKISVLLDDDRVTSNIFLCNKNGKEEVSTLSFLAEQTNDALEIAINSAKCTNNIINMYDDTYHNTVLSFSILSNKIFAVATLLNSNKDLTRSFLQRDVSNRSVMMLAITDSKNKGTVMFDMLFNSKYMSEDLLLLSNEFGHNSVIFAVRTSLDITKKIVESEYWTDKVKYTKDIDNDFLLLFARHSPDIVDYLINSDKCPLDMISMTNSLGMTCAHHYSHDECDSSMEILLKSDKCTQYLINIQDIHGNTCMHTACYKNPKSVEHIIRSKFFTDELILIRDSMGENAFVKAVENYPESALEILKSLEYEQDLCHKMLMNCNFIGDTAVHSAAKSSYPVIKYLINHNMLTEEMLSIRNMYFDTVPLMACKYNGQLVGDILNTGLCYESLFMYGHTDYSSGLIIAARYQSDAVKHILAWNKLDKILKCNLDLLNFLQIACIYSSDSVKHIIESNRDFKQLFNSYEDNAPIILATKYNPDALKYILESRYASPVMFRPHRNNTNCIDVAYNFQPKSLLIIINSEHTDNATVDNSINTDYSSTITRISSVYPEVTNYSDIGKIPLTKLTNICTHEEESSKLCQLCCEFEKSIIFTCGHTCCVGCAFKMSNCHYCRKKILSKNPIYD